MLNALNASIRADCLPLEGCESLGKRQVIILESRATLGADACGSKVLTRPAISAIRVGDTVSLRWARATRVAWLC